MSFRPYSVLAALGLALLGAGAAAASPSWLELRWPALAGCPTGAEVEATAARLLSDGEAPQPVTAEALLTADAAGYTLQLHVRDAGGDQRRTLHSPRCEALADATAVILAVAAAPIGVAARVVAAPPVPPNDTVEVDFAPPSSAPVGSLAPAPSPTRRRPGLAVGFTAAAGIGPTERFAAGLSGHVALLWQRVRLDLRGSGWFRSPLALANRPGVGADLQLTAGAVRGCPRLLRRKLALELCGGLELGALLAEGVGLEQNQSSRGLWAAGLLAPGLQWRPLRRLALGLEVEALIAFTRRQYATGDAGIFHSVPPVGVRLGGGVAVQLF